ncbi:C/D box methylation guide ribonucleoprotein complex aNOP56 subunit [Ignicoccus pacificus DSM 13166]|uniref:C/D box methylation guide ribonucleoprotein complex aNOP56 subunit n=1 Tax=Ignicoccus pacificus DSM 13166 TaxID=940294 RepID=A0A977KAV9_9CREN|nr:C/D box methylation guide ribonucleoprotein complex aNOP56 subunit [Ignicoccus pacificus DSM 13166]
MEKWLVQHAVGAFLVNENNEVERFEPNPKDIDQAVQEAMVIEGWTRGIKEGTEKVGGLSSAAKRLLENLKEEGFEGTIVFETEGESREASSMGFEVKVVPANDKAIYVRENVAELSVKYGMMESKEEFYDWLHKLTIEVVRRKLRSVAQKRDLLAVHAVRTIDDIDKIINLLIARLREWYSLHFPELDDLVKDHDLYARIVAEIGSRDAMTVERLKELGLKEDLAEKIAEAAKKSTGADLTETDLEQLQKLASIVEDLYSLRRELVDYISYIMKEVAPNVTALVGPVLGARLISLAGSLENLARMPASTIQVLGAEKALFRALRTGGKPPKHGIIFQYPDIHRSPKWQRGKIARALAAKLAIAARTDYFTGRDIGEKLKEELRARIDEIKRVYQKPPKREEKAERKAPPARKRGGRRPPRRKGGKRRGGGRRRK